MLLFANDGKLFEQHFDGEQVRGEPLAIMDVQYGAVGITGDFALSANGHVLVTHPPFPTGTRLVWYDRTGAVLGILAPGVYYELSISPDGTRVLFDRPDDNGGNRDIWYLDVRRGIAARLTVAPANEWTPVWAPDVE